MAPYLMELSDAVQEIASTRRPRHWQPNPRNRFFFIVGAGISYPSIPLASGIEELCRQEIKGAGGEPPDVAGLGNMERYEKLFKAAVPQPDDRRQFLEHHIRKAPITAANFRLAHILGSKEFATLVVTTNFDELLSRALRLFGEDVIVCDHPMTTQRIDPKRPDVQVIHVHGTHWFYDCCNLKDEIESRARPDGVGSMGHLLDRILADLSPLVVGYSGWEKDVVMAALQRRLKAPLGYKLYWFCFRRADVDSLPAWLKDNTDVHFVVPPTASDDARVPGAAPAEASRTVFAPTLSAARMGESSELPAHRVFDALIQGLKLKVPRLTQEPLEFFAEHLRRNLGTEEISSEGDIYFIKDVISRVEDGAKHARQLKEQPGEKQEIVRRLERVREHVRAASYAEAVGEARKLNPADLSEAQLTELAAALETPYLNASDAEAEVQFEACALLLQLCEAAKVRGSNEQQWAVREGKALNGKGYCLAVLGMHSEAIASFDEVVRRFGDATEASLKERAAKALLHKWRVLAQDGKRPEAIASLDEVLRRFGDATEAPLKQVVAMALGSRGWMLAQNGKRSEAIASYDEVIRRFGDATEPPMKEQVAWALVNKGAALAQDGKHSEAIASYDEVIRRFGDATEPPLKALVTGALIDRGSALAQDGKHSEAIVSFDEVVRRFGDATETPLKGQVGKALFNRGFALNLDERYSEAIASYDEVIRRFGDATEVPLKELVARGLVSKGLALAADGKRSEAIATYDEVLRRFGDAPEAPLKEQVASAFLNKGITLGHDGKHAEAIARFDEVVRRFGDAIEVPLKELVAKALINSGLALAQGGKHAEAIASFDEVVRRFGDATEAPLKDLVARAHHEKHRMLTEGQLSAGRPAR